MNKELLELLWEEFKIFIDCGGKNELAEFLAWMGRREVDGHYKTDEEKRIKELEDSVKRLRKDLDNKKNK